MAGRGIFIAEGNFSRGSLGLVMTLNELKKVIADRKRGIVAPLKSRLFESAQLRFPAGPLAEDCLLVCSILEKPASGDVVVIRLNDGSTVAGELPRAAAASNAPKKKRHMRRAADMEQLGNAPAIILRNTSGETVSFQQHEVNAVLKVVDAASSIINSP